MKKRYLILTALLAMSLAACSQEKAKMKMAQLRQSKLLKLMEQSEVRLKELPRKKQKWLTKETTTASKGNTMKSS